MSAEPLLPTTKISSSENQLKCKARNKNNKVEYGISRLSAAILIAGEIAGSGVLALPKAAVNSGWIGLILIVICCCNALFGATRLGLCWEIIEERYPHFRVATRNPYPIIGHKAVGKWGRVLVSTCIQITLFGASLVSLLLASQIVQDLLHPLFPNTTFCLWLILFAILITPPMWLGSPKDFWFVGLGAIFTTIISCTLMFIQICRDAINKNEMVYHGSHGLTEFSFAFGIILFSFGGASTFPTIQNDMKDKSNFTWSAIAGFIAILILYLPITIGGYLTYGDHIQPNIVMSLEKTQIVTIANIFMASHLLLAFFILINPVSQEIENLFNISTKFCFKRCLIRSGMVILMVVVGELVPEFSKILALIGGSTISLGTFVLPNYFYMKLCDQESELWPKRTIPTYLRVYMWELIIIGLVGGIASTSSAIQIIFEHHYLHEPCLAF